MSKKKAIEVIKNLIRTINKMNKFDNVIFSDKEMFKVPKAKRSDLIKKKNEVIKKYKLY